MQKKQRKYEITHTESVMFLSFYYVYKMVLNLERKDLDDQNSIHKSK